MIMSKQKKNANKKLETSLDDSEDSIEDRSRSYSVGQTVNEA